MIRVLVVDDEPLVRKRICLGFDWESLGYDTPDDAEDGASALEAIRSGKYDVAVVDIAMPGMNGIELTKTLREENNPVRIIFLTGHSDFAYAKEAVRYGVCDYILKPLDEDEFTAVLTKLKKEIEEEKHRKQLVNHLARKQEHADLVLEARFFSDILLRGTEGKDEAVIRQHAENAGIETDAPYRMITVSGIDFGPDNAGMAARFREAVQSAREVSERCSFSLLLNIYEDVFAFLFYGTFEDEEVLAKAEMLAGEMQKLSADRIRLGISRGGCGTADLRKCYHAAAGAMYRAGLYGEKIGIREAARDIRRVTAGDVQELQNAMTNGNSDRCAQILTGLFDRIRAERGSYGSVLADAHRLMLGITETGSMLGVDVQLLMEYSDVEAALRHIGTLDEICTWFIRLTGEIIENRNSRESEQKEIPVIMECCRYLKENCDDADLTQNEVAEQIGLTAAYLSTLFKKTMGVSMKNYLRTLRLERARSLLLKHPDEDIRRIAEKVGYSDEFYFSRSFKKYYGVSPSQVRRNVTDA